MNSPGSGRVAALVALGVLGAGVAPALAAGFGVENQGARAMGFAGAYVAQAVDPSAIFYNAAGVGFLKGKQLYVSGGLGSYNTDFTGEGPFPAAGTLESTDRPFTVLPSIYYTQQVSDTVRVGVGVNRPFGYRAQWSSPDTFTGRYICVDCQVSSWGVNPTVAWQVRDRLSVGFGLDVRFSSFRPGPAAARQPEPVPRAHRRGLARAEERERHRPRLQRRAPREAVRVGVGRHRLPPQGERRLRSHGHLHPDPSRATPRWTRRSRWSCPTPSPRS